MKLPCTKSGKCGNMVWQRNRYGPICYPAFIPANPRTPAQQAIRGVFGAVSRRWRTLTEEQRLAWIAAAASILSKPRLGQSGPLTGCQLFVKANVYLAYRGQPQVDLPPLVFRCPRRAVPSPYDSRRSPQVPIAYTTYLQANRLLADWSRGRHKRFALHPAPA